MPDPKTTDHLYETVVLGMDEASGPDFTCYTQGRWVDGVLHIERTLYVVPEESDND